MTITATTVHRDFRMLSLFGQKAFQEQLAQGGLVSIKPELQREFASHFKILGLTAAYQLEIRAIEVERRKLADEVETKLRSRTKKTSNKREPAYRIITKMVNEGKPRKQIISRLKGAGVKTERGHNYSFRSLSQAIKRLEEKGRLQREWHEVKP